MVDDESTPKLHIDSDWKAEAQAERERLAAEEEARAEEQRTTPGAAGGRELPPADFRGLVGVLASQALLGLGAVQDPQSKGVVIDLEGARFSIDLLAVLEEKTKGNLSDEETTELNQLIQDLRSRFVYVSQLIAQQAMAEASEPGAAPVVPPTPGNPPRQTAIRLDHHRDAQEKTNLDPNRDDTPWMAARASSTVITS